MDYGITIGAGLGAPVAAGSALAATGGSNPFWYLVGALGLVTIGATLKRLVPKHEV